MGLDLRRASVKFFTKANFKPPLAIGCGNLSCLANCIIDLGIKKHLSGENVNR